MMNVNVKPLLLACIALICGGCTFANNNNKAMEKDTFMTRSGKEVVITPIKHACVEINYNGVEFEIDPVSTASQPTTDYSMFPKADYIIVTHDHSDHLDTKAISDLSKPSTRIIANEECAKQIKKCAVMRNGDSLKLTADIALYAVPAYNTTPGHTQFHPKGRDNGFILVLDGLRVYIAGDTEDIHELSEIRDIDIAFLPCNQPYTMTPAQLRHATEIIKPKVLFPYHYGDTSVDEMVEATKGLGVDVRIRSFK